jgi:hypothetical protein
MSKYSYFENDTADFPFSVVHINDNGEQTFIAVTDTIEKAHFLATAANSLSSLDESEYPGHEKHLTS